MCLRALVVGGVTILGLLYGLVPELSGHSITLIFSMAYAQDVRDEEVTDYAQAVLDMEPVRQKAYNEIKQIIGKDPPAIVCDKPESLSALTGDARKIARSYCEESEAIVQKDSLTIGRFNTITKEVQSDPSLKKRVQDELVRLQAPAH